MGAIGQTCRFCGERATPDIRYHSSTTCRVTIKNRLDGLLKAAGEVVMAYHRFGHPTPSPEVGTALVTLARVIQDELLPKKEDSSLTTRAVQWLRSSSAGDSVAVVSSFLDFLGKERDRIRDELTFEWIKVLDETKAEKNRAVIQASNERDIAAQQRQMAKSMAHAIEEALAYLSASDYDGVRRRLTDALSLAPREYD